MAFSKKIFTRLLLGAAAFMVLSQPAFAERGAVEGSDYLAKDRFQLRVRALGVVPDEESSVTAGGARLNGDLDVSNALTPEVDLTYFLTNNIAVEAIAGTAQHELDFNGANLGDTWILCATCHS